MTPGAPGALSFRSRLVLLFVAPLILALPYAVRSLGPGSATAERLETDASELQSTVRDLLQRAAWIAEQALADSPRQALTAAAIGPWHDRLEGVGVLGPDLAYIDWAGSPAEPPAGLDPQNGPGFTIRVDGVRTRLLLRTDADARGRTAYAAFVIDSTLDDLRFAALLPRDLYLRHDVRVEFVDSEAQYGEALADAARHDELSADLLTRRNDEPEPIALRVPDRPTILAVARLTPIAAAHRAVRSRALGGALATSAFVALGLVLFDWSRRGRRDWIGWASVSAGIVLARGVLAWARAPALLLPRELGSPSLFGASAPLDLLASPADLALTAATLYLLAGLARAFLPRRGGPGPALLAAGLAPAMTVLALKLTLLVVRNSRMSVLESPAELAWGVPLLIWLGPVLALLAAAEGWVALVGCMRRRPGGPFAVALTFLPLACLCGVVLESRLERLVLERLSSEYARQIVEQTANRRLALQLALGQVQAFYRGGGPSPAPRSLQPNLLAYGFWSSGELFHGGYRSGLDFYGTNGTRLSHFGFDVPELDDTIETPLDPRAAISFREEEFLPLPGLDVRQRLLHAEVPVVRAGELLGLVVGHVVDEPDNLPFLPWSRPYLAAMGPDAPGMLADGLPAGPEYVLYDEEGVVALTTLLQPPARGEVETSGAADHGVRVTAGKQPHLGVALTDERGLHLLLVPERGVLERLATVARLALIGLALLALHHLAARLLRVRGARDLLRELRGSLYNKLLGAVLLASVPPLVLLALFLQGYLERRGDAIVIDRATQYVSSAQRVIEDYSALQLDADEAPSEFNDNVLYWLRRVIGQEIHLYDRGVLKATSKRELFTSGLLPERLDGGVEHALAAGLPYLVVPSRLGPDTVPVAYAPIRLFRSGAAERVIAIPLVLEQRQVDRAISRIGEMILLATVALLGLLAIVAAQLARTVARPVRELVDATGRISEGDYATRLDPRTHDEVAELVVGFNAMASALSRQRADLEEQRDYMETLLRHDTTGVISLDPQGRVVTLNPAAAELVLTRGDSPSIGSDLAAVLGASPALKPLALALQGPAGRPGQPADVDVGPDSERRRLRLVRVELHKASGESVGTLILLDDVTDLMRSNQLAAWAEMAQVIAHEIKNPLTPIQLSTDHLRRLLADRAIRPLPAIDTCLDTIAKQVRALYEIAGEFSTYAKLPALDRRPTDPAELMRGVVSPYRLGSPAGRVVREDYGPAPAIAADRRVLSRALVNLVENALQAMGDAGTLRAGVEHDAARDEVVLSIGDTGPGLEPEVRARLFEPYFSTKSGGTGLGLAIVRRAVEAHGGRIEVESVPGHGTLFRIGLPVHHPG